MVQGEIWSTIESRQAAVVAIKNRAVGRNGKVSNQGVSWSVMLQASKPRAHPIVLQNITYRREISIAARQEPEQDCNQT
ncbi:hypothetical protein DPMN_157607 [Dreissena polymorpha]|uniref:Uncharacterized protein n=1 Tax=Dreissena polymorpha TaxID=45954 RepID=A0A9D4EJR8_DREPO|nr:hypothetical protein DPMN_157607 [Dreissena polymorpha]